MYLDIRAEEMVTKAQREYQKKDKVNAEIKKKKGWKDTYVKISS